MTRLTDIVSAADAFDFSKYRAGDVICIPMREIMMRGPKESAALKVAIANAAQRNGLEWTISQDIARMEWRIWFR